MKTFNIFALVSILSLLYFCSAKTISVGDKQLITQRSIILSNNLGSVIKPRFISLAPGVVSPEGWLKQWAESAASGITGHLDEMAATFREGWKGKGFVAKGANPKDGTGWPLEQCSYWLDGATRLAYILGDTALIRKVSTRLDMVVNGVLNGGETFVYWKPKSFLEKDGFNSWAHSQMGRALVAYYQGSGNRRVLDALVKVYSQFPLPALPDSFDNPTGAVNVDAMLQTYQMSGNRQILDKILKMAGDSVYKKSIEEWNSERISYGHGVNTYENIRVPALIYPWTGNKKELKATETCIKWIEKNNLLPCGVASTEEFMAGIGSAKNVETCNIVTSAWTYQQVYQITGDGSYGDRVEKIFFNAAPVPVARDYKTMSYYHSPNRIQNVIPVDVPEHPNIHADPQKPDLLYSAYEYRPLGHPTLCCVGNLSRVIPNYIMHMWMATSDKGIAATLYGPSTLKTIVGSKDTEVRIAMQTTYPFSETINISIEIPEKVSFPLYLRIPGWCNNPTVQINDKLVELSVEDGFVRIEREWKNGDRINLHFPMSVTVIRGQETPYPQNYYYQNPKARLAAKLKNVDNPFESVLYGPLLFALPLTDQDPNMQVKKQIWNYALDIKDKIADTEVEKTEMPSHWQWQLESPIKLVVKAKSFGWAPTEMQPLPPEEVDQGVEARITLIPYGCTKFRVSMFPVAK